MQNTRKLCFEVNVTTGINQFNFELPQRRLWRRIRGRSSLPIILGLWYGCFTWTPGNDPGQISPSQIKIREVSQEESRLAGQNQQPHRSSICSVPTSPTIASKRRLSRSPWHIRVSWGLRPVSPWTQAIYWILAQASPGQIQSPHRSRAAAPAAPQNIYIFFSKVQWRPLYLKSAKVKSSFFKHLVII